MPDIPYKIAVLVYLYNPRGQVLLLHRLRPPNQGRYSPIGGKLEQATGESPYACALREIHEEAGLQLSLEDLRLMGIVSERAFPGSSNGGGAEGGGGGGGGGHPAHWLMFCFEVLIPVDFPEKTINEGKLEWIDIPKVPHLNIPDTDRQVIWPLVTKHSWGLLPATHRRPDVFSVHIDCTDSNSFKVIQEHQT